jgi:hypothetical protein
MSGAVLVCQLGEVSVKRGLRRVWPRDLDFVVEGLEALLLPKDYASLVNDEHKPMQATHVERSRALERS